MARLDRRLELLEIKHKAIFIKPALVKLYKIEETPSEEDLIEQQQARRDGRLVLCFFAKNMGSDDESFKRAKKRSKKK